VIATVATDSRQYRENPSYKDAALRTKALLEATGAVERERPRLEAVRERFLRDFGGTLEEWAAPPETDIAPR
jgi:hypothetical protein